MSFESLVGFLAESLGRCFVTSPDLGSFWKLFEKGGLYRGRDWAGGDFTFAFSLSAALALFAFATFAFVFAFALALALAVLAFILVKGGRVLVPGLVSLWPGGDVEELRDHVLECGYMMMMLLEEIL